MIVGLLIKCLLLRYAFRDSAQALPMYAVSELLIIFFFIVTKDDEDCFMCFQRDEQETYSIFQVNPLRFVHSNLHDSIISSQESSDGEIAETEPNVNDIVKQNQIESSHENMDSRLTNQSGQSMNGRQLSSLDQMHPHSNSIKSDELL